MINITSGKPISLFYSRNLNSAKQFKSNQDFGRELEPHGEYMNVDHKPLKAVAANWETGTIHFKNPIVLDHKSTDSNGWKKDLSVSHGGKTGKALSDHIKKLGHDGIITKDKYGLSETINLTGTKEINEMTGTTYHGEHTSPDAESGAPIHNLKGVYPDDFHTNPHHYGDGQPYDSESTSVLRSVKDKPKAAVKIYRAVPIVQSHQDKIDELEHHKRHILRTGKVPPGVKTTLNSSKYYDKACDDLDHLRANPPKEEPQKIKINVGDWVTASRSYAKEHGQGNLNNKYKILSKTVKASELFTDGNSVHEFGYHPKKLTEMTLLEKYRALKESIKESSDVAPELKIGRVKSLYDSGRYDVTPEHNYNGRDGVEFHAIAKRPKGAVDFQTRKVPNPNIKTVAWHDPEISSLHTPHPEDQFPRTHAELKPDSGYHQDIQDEKKPGVLYRGMSHEEFHNIKKTGEIKSNGNSNIGDEQKGLTYYSKNPIQAQNYAHSFAAAENKASGQHHAYVVAVKDPGTEVKVNGTGEDEVGIPHAISKNDILHVHVGRAYSGTHGSESVIKEWGGYESGGGSTPGTHVGWKKEAFK